MEGDDDTTDMSLTKAPVIEPLCHGCGVSTSIIEITPCPVCKKRWYCAFCTAHPELTPHNCIPRVGVARPTDTTESGEDTVMACRSGSVHGSRSYAITPTRARTIISSSSSRGRRVGEVYDEWTAMAQNVAENAVGKEMPTPEKAREMLRNPPLVHHTKKVHIGTGRDKHVTGRRAELTDEQIRYLNRIAHDKH